MKNKITAALTKGLLAGYGGKTEFTKIKRGGFMLSSSHFNDGEVVYHDEWTNSGGQELVKVGNVMFTRVYAGGEPSLRVIKKLKIKEKQINENLVSRIRELGDKTRLFENCVAETKDGWGYEYKTLDDDKDISVVTGKEVINYKNTVVFVHVFVLSPVK